MSKDKSEKVNIPLVNLMLIPTFYQIILILGDFVLLGGSELGDEVLYVYGVDAKFV